jgi:hypothetical protein
VRTTRVGRRSNPDHREKSIETPSAFLATRLGAEDLGDAVTPARHLCLHLLYTWARHLCLHLLYTWARRISAARSEQWIRPASELDSIRLAVFTAGG